MPSLDQSIANDQLALNASGKKLPSLIGSDRLHAIARCWIFVALFYFAFDLLQQTREGLTDGNGRPFGDDFINYWSGAFLAWHGRAADIFDWSAFHAFEQSVVGVSLQNYHYSYPPTFMLLTAPLAFLPYVPALGIWLVSSWYAFFRALRLATPQNALLLSIATPALFVNAVGGQNGAWTAALIGGGLLLLDKRPALAGVLFGLLIYKPHLGLLLPLALIAGRRWRALGAAAVTAATLVLLSLAIFGPDLWFAYFRNAAVLKQVILEDGAGVWHRMVSVFVFGRRLGLDVGAAYALQTAVAGVAMFFVARSWLRNDAPEIRYGLLVLGTCLATPYLQDYDLVMGAFVAVWLGIAAANTSVSLRIIQTAIAGILLLPMIAGSFGLASGFAVGPFVIAPVFALFVYIGRLRRFETASPLTR